MLEFTKIIKWLRILLEIMVKIMLFNLIDIYIVSIKKIIFK